MYSLSPTLFQQLGFCLLDLAKLTVHCFLELCVYINDLLATFNHLISFFGDALARQLNKGKLVL